MELGKRIAEIRKEHTITQEGLAEICSVTRQTISNWENGKSYPDLETLVLLSDTFGVSLDELLKGDRKMVSTITREQKQGRHSILKVILTLIMVIAIAFGIYAGVHTREMYIPYEESGITVTDIGEMNTTKNFDAHISYSFITETVDGENHKVVFTFLTNDIWSRCFVKNRDNNVPFADYSQVAGKSIGRDGERHEDFVTEVYYLPEKYVDDLGLLSGGHPLLIPPDLSEAEAIQTIQRIKESSILIWERK